MACNCLRRVRSAAVVLLFERHIVELKTQLGMGDQHRFFQRQKRLNHSAFMTREGYCCKTRGISERDGCDSSARSLLNAKSDILDPDIPKKLP